MKYIEAMRRETRGRQMKKERERVGARTLKFFDVE